MLTPTTPNFFQLEVRLQDGSGFFYCEKNSLFHRAKKIQKTLLAIERNTSLLVNQAMQFREADDVEEEVAPKRGARGKRREKFELDMRIVNLCVKIVYDYQDPQMSGKFPAGFLDCVRALLLRLVRIVDPERRDNERYMAAEDKNIMDAMAKADREALQNSIDLEADEAEDEASAEEDEGDLEDLVVDDDVVEMQRIEYKPAPRRIQKQFTEDPETDEDERYSALRQEDDDTPPESAAFSEDDEDVTQITRLFEGRYKPKKRALPQKTARKRESSPEPKQPKPKKKKRVAEEEEVGVDEVE